MAAILPAALVMTESTASSAPRAAFGLTDGWPNSGQNTQPMPTMPSSAANATPGVIRVPKQIRAAIMVTIGPAEAVTATMPDTT